MCKFKTDKITYSKRRQEQRMAIAKISLHCILNAKKLTKRQIRDSLYSKAATNSYIGVLNFSSKSLKNSCERVHFW